MGAVRGVSGLVEGVRGEPACAAWYASAAEPSESPTWTLAAASMERERKGEW